MAAVLALSACALFKPDQPLADDKPATPAGPELIGRVASVAIDRKFVLIESYQPWNREAGTVLTTRGTDERAANLLVTGEFLGQFAAADIQSGSVEIGDAVYSRHVPKPLAEASTDAQGAAEAVETPPEAELPEIPKNN